jgi:uncharacterized protein (UPF0332 family)
MTKDDQQYIIDLIKYREERSWETYEEAMILAENNKWNACVNRLYYACFYAVSALLLKHGYSSAKHTGIRSLFNKNFVKKGLVKKEIALIYNLLFERRQEGDYKDFVKFHKVDVLPWLSDTKVFLDAINKLFK